MVWPTLGSKTAKEQISTEQTASSTAFTERSIYWFIAPHFTDEGEIWHRRADRRVLQCVAFDINFCMFSAHAIGALHWCHL